jgi:ribosomal protein S27AE
MNTVPVHVNSRPTGRIAILAMQEILGQDGVDLVLELARSKKYHSSISASNPDLKFPFERISQIQTTLEQAYGPRAGRGLSMRVGRACLKYSLREFGCGLGITGLSFRLLPLPARIRVGCEALTGFINQFSDQRVSLDQDKGHFYFHIAPCPHCGDGQFKSPRCAVVVGFLQEALYWVSAGKYFLVEEKNCVVCGDPECTIAIDQTPLG